MTKSETMHRLIKNLYAYRISTPTTMYRPKICTEAAHVIEVLLQELEEERYRHDRLQDWTVARDAGFADCPLPEKHLLFGGGKSETE